MIFVVVVVILLMLVKYILLKEYLYTLEISHAWINIWEKSEKETERDNVEIKH